MTDELSLDREGGRTSRATTREDQSRPPRRAARGPERARPHAGQDSGIAAAIVADVSFISLKLALPAALALASRDAWAVFLVKPKFEIGRWGTPRSGVVKEQGARATALAEVTEWIKAQGWHVIGHIDSPITGGDGNKEYLLAAARGEAPK